MTFPFPLLNKAFILVLMISLCSCRQSNDKAIEPKNPAPIFNNIGTFHHTIKTNLPLAQRYFDQGLVLFYSFEFGESIRSFRAATQIDPQCAMCFWGLALALGSKTDMPIKGDELDEAKRSIQSAGKFVDPQNIAERLYISALKQRYETTNSKIIEPFAGLCSSYTQVEGNNVLNYANAMQQVVSFLPYDLDAKTLYVAALFDKVQWNFWNKQSPNSETLKIIRLLESIIHTNPNHPGASHLYVHVIEGSPYPERALSIAKGLSKLVPFSEHLAHMPAHTYYSLGLYHNAVIANQTAIEKYKKYALECKAQGFQPEIQYLYYHNIDYLAAVASMEGQKQLSISTANILAKEIAPLVHDTFFLQKMLTPSILMLARFGEWNTILQFPAPKPQYQYATGIWHYARGLAEAHFNRLDAAKKELKLLIKIVQQGPTSSNLSKPGFTLLKIAMYTLHGVIEGHTNHKDTMIKSLKNAVSLQDEIDSFDPPPWYFPVRELLGIALLKTGHPEEAKNVFKQDLEKHPHNPWSLYGLSKSESALGNQSDALNANKKFELAWRHADIDYPIYPL